MSRAAAFLARRDRFESEVRTHLTDFPDEEVESVIQKLIQRGFIDDKRVARLVLNSYTGKRSAGNDFLANVLADRGCDPNVAAALIKSLEESDPEIERALVALDARGGNPSPATAARWLASRGFRDDVIESVLSDRFTED